MNRTKRLAETLRERAQRTPWLRPLAAVLSWELGTLVLVLVVAAGLWGFVELADEVLEGETTAVDRRILLALRTPGDSADPLGPGWVEEIGRDLTALGGVAVLVLFTALAALSLALQRKGRAALFLVAAVAGGVAASSLLKLGFDRPRPDLVPHGSHVYTTSFPSGHSMMAAVTYLSLGAVLLRTQRRRRLQVFFVATAVLLALLVGVSRVYLGVHWPTDVLAGWVAGAVWACLCWVVARWLQLFGTIERGAPLAGEPRGRDAGALL